MTIFLSIVIAVFTTLLGFTVFIRDTKKPVNRLFFLASIVAVLWAANFQTIESHSTLRAIDFTNGLSYVLGLVLVFFVVLLTYYFPVKRNKKSFLYFSFLLVLVAVISPTNLIKGNLVSTGDGHVDFNAGPLSYIYVLVLIVALVILIMNLIIDKKKFTLEQESQAKLIAIGFGMSAICSLFMSMIAPMLHLSSFIVDLAPYSVVFYVLLTTIAISKYKLFDFRIVLIRSVGYAFAILVATVVYAIFGYIINAVLPQGQSGNIKLIQNVSITVLLIFTYPYIKARFNKLTNKIFFRDAYDPQIFLGELNRALVTDAQLDSLLTKVALVIQENLKASFCTFFIRETSYFPNRFIGAHRKDPEIEDLDMLNALSLKVHKKVHSTEIESRGEDEKELNKILKENDIEILARLVSTLDYEVAGIGYIFIGPKKSGSLYTAQDIKIIEIIANELVIAIENVLRFEEIEQFNVTLQKKIDDATKQLKSSNDKLKALDEAKDEFVSMASHQLRTPLTSIKGYISMVLEGDAGAVNDTQKQMLGQAFFSSQRMVYLISDLLNVSRLKTGKFIIEPRPVYLPDVVEGELSQLREGAISKDITLSFMKPKEFPTLNLDEMKIRQVVMNFTDNALYYTPHGGKITVELRDKKDTIEFTVKDTGIGVPKAQQHKLFEKFYRADNARKARPDGTGLGLFMAKKVIVAQGGSIIFESVEDKGSTFGFSFPKSKLEADPISQQNDK